MTSPSRLPWSARVLLRVLVPAERRAEIEGDLLELAAARRQNGHAHPQTQLWLDLASLTWVSRPADDHPVVAESGRLVRASQEFVQDSRQFLRAIRARPTFGMLVIVTLSLGTAASTAVLSLCDRVLWQPLPYFQPDRIVALERGGVTFGGERVSVSAEFASLPIFASTGLYSKGAMNLGDEREPARVTAAAVSADFFKVLGVPARLGRTFTDVEDRAQRVVVISDRLWRTHLSSRDPIGRIIRLNGQLYAVIGVMPPRFTVPAETEVWIPSAADLSIAGVALSPVVIARLMDGLSLRDAQAWLARKAGRGGTPKLSVLQDRLTEAERPTLMVLALLAIVLIVVTAANVAGLLVSQLPVRQRELQVRSALGASGGRLIRQLLTEIGALACAGGVLGTLLAWATIGVVLRAWPDLLASEVAPDKTWRFLATAGVVTGVCATVSALATLSAAGVRLIGSQLRGGGAWTDRSIRTGHGLVVAQVASTFVLVCIAACGVTTVRRLTRQDLGFGNAHGLTFEIAIPEAQYPNATAVAQLVDRVTARLSAMPGVRAAGATNGLPGSPAMLILDELSLSDRSSAAGDRLAISLNATPGFFQALGIRFIAGQTFSERDRAGAPPVVVISESTARTVFGGASSAIGRALLEQGHRGAESAGVVIGVVADVNRGPTNHQWPLQVYRSFFQTPSRESVGFVLDMDGNPADRVADLRRVMRDIDPDLPPYRITTVPSLQAEFLATPRLTSLAASIVATIALGLAALGLYSVLSLLVAQKTREIGVRMALGATGARVRVSVVSRGSRLFALGILTGTLAGVAGVRILETTLPSLDPPSATTLVIAAAIITAVSFVAMWQAARRASSVDPLVALRVE